MEERLERGANVPALSRADPSFSLDTVAEPPAPVESLAAVGDGRGSDIGGGSGVARSCADPILNPDP